MLVWTGGLTPPWEEFEELFSDEPVLTGSLLHHGCLELGGNQQIALAKIPSSRFTKKKESYIFFLLGLFIYILIIDKEKNVFFHFLCFTLFLSPVQT